MLKTRKPASNWYYSNQEVTKPQQGIDRAKEALEVDKWVHVEEERFESEDNARDLGLHTRIAAGISWCLGSRVVGKCLSETKTFVWGTRISSGNDLESDSNL